MDQSNHEDGNKCSLETENRMDVSLQYCDDDDDDDEVFFGKVGPKEQHKASKYSHRKTALFDINFRKDHRLMRYTMNRLSRLSLCQGSHLGSEGSESSQSPLGSGTSTDSLFINENGSDSPVTPMLNGWLNSGNLESFMAKIVEEYKENEESNRKCENVAEDKSENGIGQSVSLSARPDNDLDQLEVFFKRLEDIAGSGDVLTEHLETENSCKDNNNGKSILVENCDISDTQSTGSSPDDDDSDESSDRIKTDHFYNTQNISSVDNSPLVNSSFLHPINSPPVNLSNHSNIHSRTIADIFEQVVVIGKESDDFGNVPESPRIPDCSSEEQEVPRVVSSGLQLSSDVYVDVNDYELATADVSILTVGQVMEESIMDVSRRIIEYNNDDSVSNDSTPGRSVPDIDSLTDVNSLLIDDLIRRGITFQEKDFSPTLTVVASPQGSDEDFCPYPEIDYSLPFTASEIGSVLMDHRAGSPPRMLVLSPSQASDGPMSPADVRITSLKDSPKKNKVKRLSKSSHSEPPPMGTVFSRLNSLESQQSTPVQKTSDSTKLKKSFSASRITPRLNTASLLRLAAGNSPGATPKRNFYFGSKERVNSIRTTGSTNRQAVSQVTMADLTPKMNRMTTPRSHSAQPLKRATPSCAPRNEKLTPLFIPKHQDSNSDQYVAAQGSRIYRSGTPRFNTPRVPNRSASCTPPPRFELDESADGDMSILDDSIILQEKKVELERLRAEKLRLQKKLAHRVQSAEGPRHRSPLMPTTADNLPRVSSKTKQALTLTEPALDAITLVHTLCNSQHSVKLVSKYRAATVVKHTCDAKEPSKIQWPEDLVKDAKTIYAPNPLSPTRKSILVLRSSDYIYPFDDQVSSPVVVTKSTRRSLSYGKELSPLAINKSIR